MQRRHFIKLSIISSSYILAGCGSDSSTANVDADVTTQETLSGIIKGEALAIPTLLDPTPINGVKEFNLSINENSHKFFHEFDTKTFGINSTYLGPTLLLREGEKVSINYTNNLQEITTMHGHGMHVPVEMDGGPHQKIQVGEKWSAQYTVKQKASTNWYHPHQMGKTADHVYMGLAGMIIVEDDESQNLSLPKTYGVDDIPLVIQDRVFDTLGQFDYTPTNSQIMRGYRGDTFITNGQIEPVFEAKSGLLRLRLLNGSNAGVYHFSFSDNREFSQIASDNSLLETAVVLNSVRLSPGERAEIVVDLAGDASKLLQLNLKEAIDNRTQTVLSIKVSTQSSEVQTLASSLTTLEPVDESSAVKTRTFTLEGSGNGGNPRLTINGKEMNMSVYNETIPLNQVEIWEVTNTMGMPHNFHIHATHFRVISRNDKLNSVAENEKGYKDVVFIPANEKVKLLIKMVDFSTPLVSEDNPMPPAYMYHCHFLEHEDAGMMGQFLVSS